MSSHLPCTVIGGYLGAGKTTLLNHLLSNAGGLRVAALINDFGSVAIDVDLIRSHDGDTINLANGCLCCTLVHGFAQAIARIRARSEEFDQIVIEASGVADPAKIAQYGQMYELPIDGIIVLADAELVRTQAVNQYVGDTVIRQFGQADLIVLNKTDLVSSDALASLRAWLSGQSPGTPIFETVQSRVPLEVLLGASGKTVWAPPPASDGAHHFDRHADAYQTWTIERSGPLSQRDLERFAEGLGSDVYRAKGFVYLKHDPEHRHVYQQVGARWSVEPGARWGVDQRRTVLVVIGRKGAITHPELEVLLGPTG